MEKPLIGSYRNGIRLVIVISFLFYLSLLSRDGYSRFYGGNTAAVVTFPVTHFVADNNSKYNDSYSTNTSPSTSTDDSGSCTGKYIYVHDLPSRFNEDVLKDCKSLIKWFDMCPSVLNSGFGPQAKNGNGVLLHEKCWYSTNQFMLEVVFRERMKHYKCLTNDSSMASAIYLPFYPGLDVGRYLWDNDYSLRDASAYDIARWVSTKPEWKRLWGRDHFFVGGRPAWDLRREGDVLWGGKLMSIPESMNMTMLTVEKTSWSNELAIPYPSHFHPTTRREVAEWQDKMRNRTRRYLYSFAGAPRPAMNESIRGEIIRQCAASRVCKRVDCNRGNTCENPVEVMKIFQDSIFCLQPPGDSYTRRSAFDAIIAGCIPVFFHPGSAYVQYLWHLPRNSSQYSAFIPIDDVRYGKVLIEEALRQVSSDAENLRRMREEVINLIPKVIYADPRRRGLESQLEDAFSVAIKGVLERIEKVRKTVKEGLDPSIDFAKPNQWTSKLEGTDQWSHYFQ